MKVFTVGLPDQKASDTPNQQQPEKEKDSPPPVYAAAVPAPALASQMMAPPSPTYMVRKSRGYKGILMVMLAVFLMAIFALTLSEIAYNRHREENYFRLRWAELKHRFGYGRGDRFRQQGQGPFDYYGRAYGGGGDRFFGGNRNHDLADDVVASTTTTTSTQPPPPSSSSSSSSSSTTTDEVQPPFLFRPQQQQMGPSSFEQRPVDPSAMIRDARLRFLKNILQRIKQRAEAMGFDGTMQVSVIEVEPQVIDNNNVAGDSSAAQKQSPFFNRPNSIAPPPPAIDPKSNAFLDGFGEIHQPTLFQQNQFMEQQQQQQGQSQWPQPEQREPARDFGGDTSSSASSTKTNTNANNGFFRPEWRMISPHQPPHIQLQRPPIAFDRWSSASGSGVSQMGQDASSGGQTVVSGVDDQQAPPPPPPPPSSQPQQQQQSMMIPLFPIGQQQQQQLPVPKPFGEGQEEGQQGASIQPSQEVGGGGDWPSYFNPSQFRVVGEIYGRKFGRMLQDIISNRIAGFQQQMNGGVVGQKGIN